MGKLYDQLESVLLPGMHVPESFRLLYEWIEAKGMYRDYEDGKRAGWTFPLDEMQAGWKDEERLGGSLVHFTAEGNKYLHAWCDVHPGNPEHERVCVFGNTGGDGSMAAFWLDDQGKQKIVHMGSGSGSTSVCVITEDPVDYLRLIAIGYDEPCFYLDASDPPNTDTDRFVHPNVDFQDWVKDTFGVSIPRTANEIVKYAPDMDHDEDPEDEFARWCLKVNGRL